MRRVPLRHKHWDPAFLAYVKQLEKKKPVIFCGDLNVARSDMDIHPKERKPNQVGARKDERLMFEQILSHDLVDVAEAEFERERPDPERSTGLPPPVSRPAEILGV